MWGDHNYSSILQNFKLPSAWLGCFLVDIFQIKLSEGAGAYMIWVGSESLAASVQISISPNLCSANMPREENPSKKVCFKFTYACVVVCKAHSMGLYHKLNLQKVFNYKFLNYDIQTLVPTYLPGAAWFHLVHVDCVIRSSTKCVKLDVSCHTLYLDLPGTKKSIIPPVPNIQHV